MNSTLTTQLIGGLGGTEMLIILAVVVLLFGASKLPELARGSGQALRIFKAETKGLTDSDPAPVTDPVAAHVDPAPAPSAASSTAPSTAPSSVAGDPTAPRG